MNLTFFVIGEIEARRYASFLSLSGSLLLNIQLYKTGEEARKGFGVQCGSMGSSVIFWRLEQNIVDFALLA